VLIVDDEADVATYMATVLRAHGHTVTIANSVQSGLAAVNETRPDLICLDIMMPHESGISMYRRLKQDSTTASIPIVVISGVELEGKFDIQSYLPDESVPPPECFLEKPVNVEEFLDTVERLLSAGRS
jgi:CheY-like chemotaxis protein